MDPLAEDFVGWTPYHYVHQNPINLIDPTGMFAEGPGDEFETKDEAAKDFANEYNSISIDLNSELSSDIYSYKRDGKKYYSYNIPQGSITEGDENNTYGYGVAASSEQFPSNLTDFKREGDVHTHGKELQKGDNVPSDQDFYRLSSLTDQYGSQYESYVVVPSGNLFKITDFKRNKYELLDNTIPNDPNSKQRNININTKSTPAIAPILHVFNKKGIILRTIQGSNITNYE